MSIGGIVSAPSRPPLSGGLFVVVLQCESRSRRENRMTTVFIVVGGILLFFGYLKLKARARRHSAALNIVLAKATFDSLPPDQQIKVHERAIAATERASCRRGFSSGPFPRANCSHPAARGPRHGRCLSP